MEWKELSNAYLLSTGTHTFTIAYRNGFLDKILITNSGTVPVGVGGEATNRGAILGNLTVSKGKLTQLLILTLQIIQCQLKII